MHKRSLAFCLLPIRVEGFVPLANKTRQAPETILWNWRTCHTAPLAGGGLLYWDGDMHAGAYMVEERLFLRLTVLIRRRVILPFSQVLLLFSRRRGKGRMGRWQRGKNLSILKIIGCFVFAPVWLPHRNAPAVPAETIISNQEVVCARSGALLFLPYFLLLCSSVADGLKKPWAQNGPD